MDKKHCTKHFGNQDFLDSIIDQEIIEKWFDPTDNDKACDTEGMGEIREKAHALSKALAINLPENRIEKTMAILKLQEVLLWSCVCLKRAHTVANILQKRRSMEELRDQGIDLEKIKRHDCGCSDEGDPDAY